MARKSKGIPELPITLIYTEGESELQYFYMLKRKYRRQNVHAERIKVQSMGQNGLALLQAAKRQRPAVRSRRKADQTFVVFDRDRLTDMELNNCIQFAHKNQLTILLSTINFEIWILLHFQYTNRAHTARELNHILSGKNFFNTDYARFKGSDYSPFLFDRVVDAFQNAGRFSDSNGNNVFANPYCNIHQQLAAIFRVDAL